MESLKRSMDRVQAREGAIFQVSSFKELGERRREIIEFGYKHNGMLFYRVPSPFERVKNAIGLGIGVPDIPPYSDIPLQVKVMIQDIHHFPDMDQDLDEDSIRLINGSDPYSPSMPVTLASDHTLKKLGQFERRRDLKMKEWNAPRGYFGMEFNLEKADTITLLYASSPDVF